MIVQAVAGKTLVYWGTPQVQDALEAQEWPRVYRERNEIQEHRFKDMIDHGALNINYGRKKIRCQPASSAQASETRSVSGDSPQAGGQEGAALKGQQDKVAESVAKGHGTRLEQRRRTLLTLEQECPEAKASQTKCAEQAATLGPAGQRADRDCRKQTIMTIRSLWLENCLRGLPGGAVGDVDDKGQFAAGLEPAF